MRIDPIYLAGPTAVGKSAVALELAERIGGEIIAVDSMQVYRGLDLGTAKPSREDRERVPHHLIDVAELAESFDAAKFAQLAAQAVAAVQGRGARPIFCGGTGFYFKAYLSGLGSAPRSDPALRQTLENTPLALLLEELRGSDPRAFATIDRQNPRRVIRAIEIIRLTGAPASAQKADWRSPDPENREPGKAKPVFIVLDRAPNDLTVRINERVDRMFALGIVAETERLLQCGLAQNKTAMQALGYRQVVEYLRGQCSLAEAILQVKMRTRHFAKRQGTWFRHHASGDWLRVQPADLPGRLAQRLAADYALMA